MSAFFVVWIVLSFVAWGILWAGNRSFAVERRRRKAGDTAHIILGRGFLLPGIIFGIAAFLLPLLAIVQGIEILDRTYPNLASQVPEWVYWVIAIGLIVGLLFSIGLGAYAAPRLMAQRVLIVTPYRLELRNRFTRKTLARIDMDQPRETQVETYGIRSNDTNSGESRYMVFEEITYTQGDESLRIQVNRGMTHDYTEPIPPRLAPNRIHFDWDTDAFNEYREMWGETLAEPEIQRSV